MIFDISPTPLGARKKLMFVGSANKQLYQAIKSSNEISKTNAKPVKPLPEKSAIEEALEQLTQMEHYNRELNRTLDFYTVYRYGWCEADSTFVSYGGKCAETSTGLSGGVIRAFFFFWDLCRVVRFLPCYGIYILNEYLIVI